MSDYPTLVSEKRLQALLEIEIRYYILQDVLKAECYCCDKIVGPCGPCAAIEAWGTKE